MWASVVVAFVGALAVCGWIAATDESNRPIAVAVGVLVVVVTVLVVSRRRWVEPASGEIVVSTFGLRRRWRLAEATAVRLVPNHAGQVLLQVRDPARRTVFSYALVARDVGGERALPPAVLRALADQVDRWAPAARGAVEALRAQAEHLEVGGPVADSPLTRRHLR
jgi:hypothetical protein